jgi:hypothetical protein
MMKFYRCRCCDVIIKGTETPAECYKCQSTALHDVTDKHVAMLHRWYFWMRLLRWPIVYLAGVYVGRVYL